MVKDEKVKDEFEKERQKDELEREGQRHVEQYLMLYLGCSFMVELYSVFRRNIV